MQDIFAHIKNKICNEPINVEVTGGSEKTRKKESFQRTFLFFQMKSAAVDIEEN
jgi:hypothetical protein